MLTPEALSRLLAARIDTRVVVFSLLTVGVWGLLLSLAPLAETFRINLTTTLARDGRRSSGAIGHRLRAALIVGQIALSVVLLVGAALLVRTFVNVQQVDPGFRSDNILSFRVALPGQRYGSTEAFNTFARRLQTELAALPGVTGAAGMSHAPYDHVPNWGGPYLATVGRRRVDGAAGGLSRHHAGPVRGDGYGSSRGARSPRRTIRTARRW